MNKKVIISPETRNELMLLMQKKPSEAQQNGNNNVENELENNNVMEVQDDRLRQIERQLNMIQKNMSIFSIVGSLAGSLTINTSKLF